MGSIFGGVLPSVNVATNQDWQSQIQRLGEMCEVVLMDLRCPTPGLQMEVDMFLTVEKYRQKVVVVTDDPDHLVSMIGVSLYTALDDGGQVIKICQSEDVGDGDEGPLGSDFWGIVFKTGIGVILPVYLVCNCIAQIFSLGSMAWWTMFVVLALSMIVVYSGNEGTDYTYSLYSRIKAAITTRLLQTIASDAI